MTRSCACCGQPFQPRPQVPDQTYCSAPGCQRARKHQWQRAKLQSDPDYRHNQRDAQRAWLDRNPDYWRNYREARPKHAQRNRVERQIPQANGSDVNLAKMDVCDLPSGVYRIRRIPAPAQGSDDSWLVEITSVCLTCPRKMDVCKERT